MTSAFETYDANRRPLAVGDVVEVDVEDILPAGGDEEVTITAKIIRRAEIVFMSNDEVFVSEHGNGGGEGWVYAGDVRKVG